MNAAVKVIGLDIAKNIFVAMSRDLQAKIVFKRTVSRSEVLGTFVNMLATAIGIESCAGSHF